MKSVLVILIAIHFGLTLVRMVARHEWLTFHLIIDAFVFLPLCLYLMELSDYITPPTDGRFYAILISFVLASLIDELFFDEFFVSRGFTRYSVKCPLYFADLANLLYVAVVLVENVILSGSWFPVRVGMDVHTESVPGLGFLTRSLFAFVSLDLLVCCATRKFRFLLWILIIVAFPVVTRHARLAASIATVQLVFLSVFMARRKLTLFCHHMSVGKKLLAISLGALIVAVSIVVVSKAALVSNQRLSENSGWDFSYYANSRFNVDTGNDEMNEVIAILYGYGPFSFNNLHNGIVECPDRVHNYWGKYSLRSLTCGIMRLHNIFDFSPYEPNLFATDVSYKYHDGKGFANVPTLFFDFYYDFGVFCVVPIILLVLFARILTNYKYKKNSLYANLVFCYFIPLFAFSSFQNLVFQGHGFIELMIIFAMTRCFFKEGI